MNMIEDTAQHAGRTDTERELLDETTGDHRKPATTVDPGPLPLSHPMPESHDAVTAA